MSRRVKVAAVSDRLPPGGLQSTPTPSPSSTARIGRPRKAAGAKARGVTVTLWPDEFEALEALRAAVSEGLPVNVPRSDLARLAFSLLLEMSPDQVRKVLAERRSR